MSNADPLPRMLVNTTRALAGVDVYIHILSKLRNIYFNSRVNRLDTHLGHAVCTAPQTQQLGPPTLLLVYSIPLLDNVTMTGGHAGRESSSLQMEGY